MAPPSNVAQLSDARAARVRAAQEDPAALVVALGRGEAWAERALLDQHTDHVERILTRILGARSDLEDLAQEVFVRAFQRAAELREPRALRGFITGITVNVAREAIRATRRRRWLRLFAPEDLPELPAPVASPEARAAVRAFYEIAGRLDAEARIAFTLRFVEGMELTDVAAACGVSLATVKRRIKAAETEFIALARGHGELADWIQEGTRWPR